jgi:glucokinase
MALVAGIDIGGTNLRLGIIDGLEIIYENRIHADFAGLCQINPPDIAWQEIISLTGAVINQALQIHPQVVSVGIGFPGFIDPAKGYIAQSPNLPGLKDVDLAGDLTRLIRKPVLVENDALAAAYGEFRLNGMDGNLIYIGLGTGVGGGLIYAGKPFVGEHGVAMEIGHLIVEPGGRICGCGNRGCLEEYASATGVAISYATGNAGQPDELINEGQIDVSQLDASQVAVLAESGDRRALEAYALAGDKLGQALAHILKVIDVSNIIIGGGMSQSWPLMQPALEQRLQADLIVALRGKLNISISSTADRAGIVGAALLSSLVFTSL